MIITIAHHKGGVGKTTLSVNTAEELQPDLIIDLDIHNSIAELNKLRAQPFNVEKLSSEEMDYKQSKATLIDLLNQSEQGKTILVDCGGFDSGLTRIAIAAADLVITPANEDSTEFIGLKRFQKTLAELSVKANREIIAHVLIYRNHINRKNFDEFREAINKKANLTSFNTVVGYSGNFDKAMKDKIQGVTKSKITKYSKSARQITALVEEIRSLLNI